MKFESESFSEAHVNLKIFSIANLHKFELAKLTHLIKIDKVPDSFKNTVHAVDHKHNTRSKMAGNLSLPQPRTEKGKTTIQYKGSKCWNSLPNSLKLITNTKTFLYELKKILLQNDALLTEQ